MPILIEKKNNICTIIINNPEVKNAVDGITAKELAAAFRNYERDDRALVAVLWGANGTFCSGANLKAIAEGNGNRIDKEGDGPMGPTRMCLSKPVIAAVAGYAVAGGLELACWCDLRVVEKNAIFGVFCRRYGVPLIDGGTVRLPRLIGLSRALEMILTGRPVTAQEAYSWGLANHIVDNGKSRQEAENLAEIIASECKGTTVTKKKLITNELAWHPICIERHLTRALKYLEYEIQPPGIIGVENRKKTGSYPEGSIIEFA